MFSYFIFSLKGLFYIFIIISVFLLSVQELIENVVTVAENTADELARSDGREVQLEEDPDLQLPFLLPEDGYSCDVVRNVPSGLQEFLDPLCQRGQFFCFTMSFFFGVVSTECKIHFS